ncbi:MAG: trigger factor [Candidatus Omnitrophota bacterium]|jgi:FKBP-type peptidyl-prolyl cis-trans isomerase (trigger factor)|nr:trigger factor [Candidatus Omnitrophota bacterium]MDD5137544.1 trigger factor [Candidatus Omnitrophota bacterium]MDD5538524.1 trigger factor [Candidatus Omnitrophota bacterium]
MKVKKTKTKENKVLLDIEVAQEQVKKKYDEVYDKIGQEAKVPGYRPGKAPRQILEQQHGALARDEVLKGLITESYEQTVKDEAIDVIDLPQISDVKLEGEVLTYKAEVEVKPEIAIKQYKGLKLKKQEIKIGPSDVEEYVKQLKKGRPEDISEEKMARGLGYKTKEEFVDCIQKQLFLKKENEERARLEKELIQQVLKHSSFVVPQTLVTRRAHELEHEAEHQMANYGLPPERIKERVKEFEPKFKAEAEEQVKVFLVLEAIAKLEKMPSDDHVLNRVIELLFAEAEWE